MSLETLKTKVEQLIEKAQNGGGGLPDWDDNSPIIASGHSYNTNNVTWELTEKGTFRWKITDINNDGKSASLGSTIITNIPIDYSVIATKIKQVDIEEGIISAGLAYAVNCERIRLPQSVNLISTANLYSLKELDLTNIKYNSNDNGTELGSRWFENYYGLERIVFKPTVNIVNQYAFSNCYSLTDFNFDNITKISICTFQNTIGLNKDIVLSPDLISINSNAFYNSAIKSVTFQNTNALPTIQSNSFGACRALTDIYCPWAEGAVANAPWGATNATIHYNYNSEV